MAMVHTDDFSEVMQFTLIAKKASNAFFKHLILRPAVVDLASFDQKPS